MAVQAKGMRYAPSRSQNCSAWVRYLSSLVDWGGLGKQTEQTNYKLLAESLFSSSTLVSCGKKMMQNVYLTCGWNAEVSGMEAIPLKLVQLMEHFKKDIPPPPPPNNTHPTTTKKTRDRTCLLVAEGVWLDTHMQILLGKLWLFLQGRPNAPVPLLSLYNIRNWWNFNILLSNHIPI